MKRKFEVYQILRFGKKEKIYKGIIEFDMVEDDQKLIYGCLNAMHRFEAWPRSYVKFEEIK